MITKLVSVDPINPESDLIKKAASIIKKGRLVAFPTETVYGLGASSIDEAACSRVYEAKGRASDNPLILHISSMKQLDMVATKVNDDMRKHLLSLWPGPITFVFKRNPKFPGFASKFLDTVAVRMPAHPVALALIEASGVPIAAPSANISGRPSPTSAKEVFEELGGKVEMILDSGNATFGIESTVIDATKSPYELLRPGAFTIEELSRRIGPIRTFRESKNAPPKSPGMKYKHYSPSTRLAIASRKTILGISKLCDLRVAILCSSELAVKLNPNSKAIIMGQISNPYTIARNLFSSFRSLEKSGAKLGVMEDVPEKGIGMAIMNRAHKAAGGLFISDPSELEPLVSYRKEKL